MDLGHISVNYGCQMTTVESGKMCSKVRSGYRLFMLILFIILYLVVGSLVFSLIEGPFEKQLIKELQSARTKFMLQHTCITGQ